MEFVIKGFFRKGNKHHMFTKAISAKTKNDAENKIYSLIGSNYACKRNLIKINSIEEQK